MEFRFNTENSILFGDTPSVVVYDDFTIEDFKEAISDKYGIQTNGVQVIGTGGRKFQDNQSLIPMAQDNLGQLLLVLEQTEPRTRF